MKLEPKAKPVRIRIKSGGEEHFNLESLKRSFSVQDLWESVTGGSLSRWLRQQNESELAKQVEAFCQIEKPSIEDYIRFSSLFFEKEMEGVPNDANALVKFYKERNLRKNFHFAFSYLLDYLDYQTGKLWYDEYKGTKNAEDWIAFFEAKIPQLQGEDEIECCQFLYKLYSANHDLAKMDYCQSKVKDAIISIAKKDKGKLDKWLASGNYFYVKLLFEDEITRGLKSNSDWIGAFERCESQLLPTQQAECFYSLYLLYKASGEETKAKEHLGKSANLGCAEAKKIVLFDAQYSYPKLTKILNHYRSGNKKIDFSDVQSIIHDHNLLEIEKEDEYYALCKRLLMQIEGPKSGYYGSITGIVGDVCYSIDAKTRRFPKYESLIVLIEALCGENRYILGYGSGSQSIRLYAKLDGKIKNDSPYKPIFQLKLTRQNAVITAEKGLKCDLRTASIVEQVVFFLETHGESYSIMK